jgi:hypothetical protein
MNDELAARNSGGETVCALAPSRSTTAIVRSLNVTSVTFPASTALRNSENAMDGVAAEK